MTLVRIAVAARKGGVGKTTLATGLASAFAAVGIETLLFDLDPQSNAAFALGVDPTAQGTAEYLTGKAVEPTGAAPHLHVFPGGPALTSYLIESLDVEELHDRIRGRNESVIIFDCPPGEEHLERLALVAADVALVTVDAHPFAVSGAARVLDLIASRRLKGRQCPHRLALIASRIDARRSFDRELVQQLAQAFPNIPIFSVRQDAALAAASADRIPIAKAAPECRGYHDLISIKEWIHDH
jgi:chromosome partitioning protein